LKQISDFQTRLPISQNAGLEVSSNIDGRVGGPDPIFHELRQAGVRWVRKTKQQRASASKIARHSRKTESRQITALELFMLKRKKARLLHGL
jgi:hypothetical protein